MFAHMYMCVCERERERERNRQIHTERMIKADKVNVNVCRIWVKDLQ